MAQAPPARNRFVEGEASVAPGSSDEDEQPPVSHRKNKKVRHLRDRDGPGGRGAASDEKKKQQRKPTGNRKPRRIQPLEGEDLEEMFGDIDFEAELAIEAELDRERLYLPGHFEVCSHPTQDAQCLDCGLIYDGNAQCCQSRLRWLRRKN